MNTKEKARRPAKNRAQVTKRLFPEMKESDMTLIDRKIHDLLITDGYRVTNTERIERSGFNHDLAVNRMEYIRGERERIFVITHEPVIETLDGEPPRRYGRG